MIVSIVEKERNNVLLSNLNDKGCVLLSPEGVKLLVRLAPRTHALEDVDALRP